MPEPVNKTPCCLGLLAHVDAGRGEPQNSPVAPLGEKKKNGKNRRGLPAGVTMPYFPTVSWDNFYFILNLRQAVPMVYLIYKKIVNRGI